MESVHDGRIKPAHGAKASNCIFFDKPVIYPYLLPFQCARKTRSQMERVCVRGLSRERRENTKALGNNPKMLPAVSLLP